MRSDRIQARFARNKLLIVPVNISDYQFELMVDTGASYTVLHKTTALNLDLEVDPKRTIKIQPASKHPILAPITKIPTVQVGRFQIHNLSVVLLDLPRELDVSGLLGMNFLRRFRMCIEPDTATLVLRELQKT